MKKINYISLLITSIPAVLSVGCGRAFPSNINYAPANSIVSPYTYLSGANFSCPGLPNVIPNMEQAIDGSDYFTVCTSKAIGNFSDLMITGKFSAANSLCVVPVQMLDINHFKAKLDTQGNPVYTCSARNADGAVLISNPMANSPSFNAIVIVESPHLNNLISCIQNNLANCPNFSFGKIR